MKYSRMVKKVVFRSVVIGHDISAACNGGARHGQVVESIPVR